MEAGGVVGVLTLDLLFWLWMSASAAAACDELHAFWIGLAALLPLQEQMFCILGALESWAFHQAVDVSLLL